VGRTASAQPSPSPGGRGDNACPAGQPRPHTPARRTHAAPPRAKGSGWKAPGAMAGPSRRAAEGPRKPSSACASPDQSRGRRPTSSSRAPPEPVPVPVPALVQSSPSGFRLLMVRGRGWRGERSAEGELGARPRRGGGKGRGERRVLGVRGGVAVGGPRGAVRRGSRRVRLGSH
jgi:hypothetical protein